MTDEFMEKTVECGSCESRFKVTEDVLVKEKEKFYPGEKRGVHLERFSNSETHEAVASPKPTQVDFAQAHYQTDVDIDRVGPPSASRTMAAIIGVSLMVLVLVIFLLVGRENGAMRNMEAPNRFVLVGFTALLGCLLVLYGMAQNRMKGILLCLILGGGLMVLPVVFPGNPMSESKDDVPSLVGDGASKPLSRADQENAETDYFAEVGYRPVAEALEKYPSDRVVGIYLRDARKLIRDKILDYLYEETGKTNRGTSYDQVDQASRGLILMVKQKISIDEIAVMCEKFGNINKIHRDLRLIDITVDPAKIVHLDPKKSLDVNSPDYYRQQLAALKSFDPEVKMKAVKRLAGVEPKSMRDDISRALIEMLPTSPNDLKLKIIKTLQVWSKPGDGADAVVLKAVQELHQEGLVSNAAMTFLVDRRVDGSEKILIDLWGKDPVAWSDLFLSLGEGAQVLLLPRLKEMDTVHIVAASDILGKLGSKTCVTDLEAVMEGLDETGKKSLQAAIDEIKKRP